MNRKPRNYITVFVISAALALMSLNSCNKNPDLKKNPGIIDATVDTNVINFADSTGQFQE